MGIEMRKRAQKAPMDKDLGRRLEKKNPACKWDAGQLQKGACYSDFPFIRSIMA